MAERLKSRRALISYLLACLLREQNADGEYYICPYYVCSFLKPGKIDKLREKRTEMGGVGEGMVTFFLGKIKI